MAEEPIKIGSKAAEDVVCAKCQKTIPGAEAHSFRGKKGEDIYICSVCKEQIDSEFRSETENPNLPGAAVLGLLAGGAATIVWYLVGVFTGYQVGYIALGAGYLVGLAVVWGSGKKRGPALQLMSVGITLLSVLVASYLTMIYYINKGVSEEAAKGGQKVAHYIWVSPFEPELIKALISPMGLLIWGIALYIAFRVPQARKM
jgi:hypothetical protein